MTKHGPARKAKRGKKTEKLEYQYSGEMAETRRREEKLDRTGKLDLKDYPIRHQVYPRTII